MCTEQEGASVASGIRTGHGRTDHWTSPVKRMIIVDTLHTPAYGDLITHTMATNLPEKNRNDEFRRSYATGTEQTGAPVGFGDGIGHGRTDH